MRKRYREGVGRNEKRREIRQKGERKKMKLKKHTHTQEIRITMLSTTPERMKTKLHI